jgi:hypothetical protein
VSTAVPIWLVEKLREQGAPQDLVDRIAEGRANGPAWCETEAITDIYDYRRDDLLASGVDGSQLDALLAVARSRNPDEPCGVLLTKPPTGSGFDAWFLAGEGELLGRLHLPWDWTEGPDQTPRSGPLPVPPA